MCISWSDPNIRIMYLIYNYLVNHTPDCPKISQIDKVCERYARFWGHDIFFLTATTKPSQVMFTAGTLHERCHCTMFCCIFKNYKSYTSHANKVQYAACSHATCRCVWGCCKFIVYIIRHHFQQIQLFTILILVKVMCRVFLDSVLSTETLRTWQWTELDVFYAPARTHTHIFMTICCSVTKWPVRQQNNRCWTTMLNNGIQQQMK